MASTKLKIVALSLAMLFLRVLGQAQTNDHWQVMAGPLTLEVYLSRTAQLFHAVDQISQWSEFCHPQYLEWFEQQEGSLSREDRQSLEQHAAFRKARGWGGGLEQTFYTSTDFDSALVQGVQAGWVTETEAAAERRVLVRFASRVDQLTKVVKL